MICRCRITGLAYSVKLKAFVNKQGTIHVCLLDEIAKLKQIIKSRDLEIEHYKAKQLVSC